MSDPRLSRIERVWANSRYIQEHHYAQRGATVGELSRGRHSPQAKMGNDLLRCETEVTVAETRAFAPYEHSTEDWGMLVPLKEPAFTGGGPIQWTCPHCEAPLVVGAASGRQFLDVLFRCYRCARASASPSREAGEPISTPQMLISPAAYALGSAVSISEGSVAIVGKQALDGYQREIGSPDQAGTGREITPTALREIADEAAALLGDRYERLLASDERGRSSSTPPRKRHRLIELLTYARETADEMDREGSIAAINAPMLVEFVATLSMFSRWRNHPEWGTLVKTLAHDTEAGHSVMQLVLASYLADNGNGVGLLPADASGKRIADLLLATSVVDHLHIELKTPTALRGPRTSALSADEATMIVAAQIDAAAATKGGQLDPDGSGILAIGGFHLGEGGLDVLAQGAAAALRKQGRRKHHLAAVTVSELRAEVTGNSYGGFGLTPGLETLVIEHLGYTGGVKINQDGASSSHKFDLGSSAAAPNWAQRAGLPTEPQEMQRPLNRAERRQAKREDRGRRRRA